MKSLFLQAKEEKEANKKGKKTQQHSNVKGGAKLGPTHAFIHYYFFGIFIEQ